MKGVTEKTGAVLEAISQLESNQYTLVGGTALSLRSILKSRYGEENCLNSL